MPPLPKRPARRPSPHRMATLVSLACCFVCGAAVAAGPGPASTGSGGLATPPETGTGVGASSPQPLYRYTDARGRTVYANRPPPANVPARVVPYAPSPPQRPAPPAGPRAPLTGNPALARPQPPAAPGPAPAPQQALVEQLARQVEALQTARNALKEGEAVRNGDERNYQRYLDRIQGLRDAVTRQEGVVDVLQGQLRLLGGGGLVE